MIYSNSVLTLNAYYRIDKTSKTFEMEKKYGPDSKIVACPSKFSVFGEENLKLALSHFQQKDSSTPLHKFGFKWRSPIQNRKDCIFRESEVEHFYQNANAVPPNEDHLLMRNCILIYTPPAVMYSDDIDAYQTSLHDVVTFFEDIDGCFHTGQKKVMKCEFITLDLSGVEAMCWAHLWTTEGELKASRY